MANEYRIIFQFDERINNAIGRLMDYLEDKKDPGSPLVTKTEALRFAIITAAANIERENANAAPKA